MTIKILLAVASVFFPVIAFAAGGHGGEIEILSGPLEFTDSMAVSAIILVITFIGIFTETVHGMERSKIAAAGAIAMVSQWSLSGNTTVFTHRTWLLKQ